MTNGNVAIVRELYDALARGDVPAVLDALAEDVEWTEAEGFPYGGTYHGPDAVLENVLEPLGTDWETFEVDVDRFVDGGDTVVVQGTYRGTYAATGERFEAPVVHVLDLEDGSVVRFQQYTDTALVREALGE